jgi:hypothetical protein
LSSARVVFEEEPLKRQKRKEGNFLAISLGEASYGFGRELRQGIAFYDWSASRILPLEEIRGRPVAFIISVHDAAITSGRWRIIGTEPLEPELQKPVKYFREDPITGQLDLYSDGHFFAPSDEDLTKLERLRIWDGPSVEERLRNHFLGRPDPHTERSRLRRRSPGSEAPGQSTPVKAHDLVKETSNHLEVFTFDDVRDWLAELQESRGTRFLIRSLRAALVADHRYLDVMDATRAISAAEIVAALAKHPTENLPAVAADWVRETGEVENLPELLQLARLAVERIHTNSELDELMAENEELKQDWLRITSDLMQRLQ